MSDLEFLRKYPTSLLESAVALFGLRPRDQGVLRPALPMRSPRLGRLAGYAVTAVVSTDAEEMHGRRDNFDYWNYIHHLPGPKVAVLFDATPEPGTGAACGKLTANILQALGCRGLLTNGGVRDIEDIDAVGFSVFSAHLTVAHGNPHVVSFGRPVTLRGASVQPGDVICADRHGAIVIPREALPHIEEAVVEIERRVGPVLEYCRAADFSPAGLVETMNRHMRNRPPWKPGTN